MLVCASARLCASHVGRMSAWNMDMLWKCHGNGRSMSMGRTWSGYIWVIFGWSAGGFFGADCLKNCVNDHRCLWFEVLVTVSVQFLGQIHKFIAQDFSSPFGRLSREFFLVISCLLAVDHQAENISNIPNSQIPKVHDNPLATAGHSRPWKGLGGFRNYPQPQGFLWLVMLWNAQVIVLQNWDWDAKSLVFRCIK